MKTLIASLIALFSLALGAAAAEEPALDGYCPVCYIAAEKAVKGTDEFAVEHDGRTYLFVSADAMKAFQAEPDKFLPQYDGLCAYGMAFGKKFESDPTVFSVVDGKLYLNKDKSIGKKFNEDPEGFIAKADPEWKAIKMKMEKEMKK